MKPKNGSRAIGTTNNGDRGSIGQAEIETGNQVQGQGPDQGSEDAKLGRSTEKQGAGHGDQRAKIGQGTHPHENQQGKHAGLDTDMIDIV